MPNHITNDGRIVIEVKVTNKTDKTKKDTKELIADGGSTVTQIDLANIKALGGKVGPAKGASNLGDDFEVSDIEMEVEIEDGTGKKVMKMCNKMVGSKFGDDVSEFMKTNKLKGIPGMDQFDSLAADPVKNPECTRAYMRAREADPPPKKE